MVVDVATAIFVCGYLAVLSVSSHTTSGGARCWSFACFLASYSNE